MRKFIIVLLFFLTGNVFLYSEESIENDSEQPQSSVVPTGSQLILYNGFGAWGFSFYDGSKLNYRSLKENLALIPENEKFIRRADTWNIFSYFFIGAAFGLIAGAMYFAGDDYTRDILFSSAHCSIILFFGSEHMFNRNINKAIGNYNFSVLGAHVIYH